MGRPHTNHPGKCIFPLEGQRLRSQGIKIPFFTQPWSMFDMSYEQTYTIIFIWYTCLGKILRWAHKILHNCNVFTIVKSQNFGKAAIWLHFHQYSIVEIHQANILYQRVKLCGIHFLAQTAQNQRNYLIFCWGKQEVILMQSVKPGMWGHILYA